MEILNFITKKDLTNGPQFASQMSQYAGLYSVSKKVGLEIIFLKEYLNRYREIKLFEAFNIDNAILSDNDLVYNTFKLKDTISDLDVYKIDNNTNWNIEGWFHLYHYWHEYRDDLINIFKFKDYIYETALHNINKIKDNENYPIVSLHVRRGDYLQYSSLNLNIEYYENALDVFREKYKNFKILVFSDDIEWCMKNFHHNSVYFSENNSNYVDMCMMTLCDSNIIANSSFSWWGAYLNTNPNKIVVCPEDYIGNSDTHHQFINKNYYPLEWIPIKIK